ncbi:thioredoxin family protein [Sulfurimonas sp.]
MKKVIIFLLLLSVWLQAEHVKWHWNYDKAHQKALKETKMLMVLLIEDNSKESIKVLHTTFTNKEYVKKINEKFISVIVIKNQKQSYPIEMLYTMTYPALFFLNEEELFIGENISGNINPKILKKYLENLNN